MTPVVVISRLRRGAFEALRGAFEALRRTSLQRLALALAARPDATFHPGVADVVPTLDPGLYALPGAARNRAERRAGLRPRGPYTRW